MTVVRLTRLLARVALVALLSAPVACTAQEASPAAPPQRPPGELFAEPTPLATYPVLQQIADRAVKIRYGSTSGTDGSPTTVSGVLFVPKGVAPEGGWPIASIGHPTAGLGSDCAPSAYPGLMGNAGTIAQFLTFGYVVVMSDFQGLGTPGPHPYLDPTTAGNNVIDAVRAARAVIPETSNAWVGFGVSQGAQAVWAANEEADRYGLGLRLVGTMSIAPVTDLRPLVDAMQAGTLTVEQKILMPMVLKGIQVRHPELVLDDFLHGAMAQNVDVFLGCAGENSSLRGIIAQAAPAADFKPSSAQAADQLRTWLASDVLPRRQASAPMFVGYGDADPIVLPQWTVDAVQRACALGDVIDAQVAPGQGHGILDLGRLPFDWVTGRFAGSPAPNSCAPA